MAYINILISRHSIEELAWAIDIDKWLWVINNANLIKNGYTTNNLKNKQF